MSSTYKQTPVLPHEEKFIKINFETMSVPDMAKALGRSPGTIYSHMKNREMVPFKNPNPAPRDRNHPFRKANRALEGTVIQRRIENRKANPK